MSRELGRLYSNVFELRQSGDYDDWKVIEEKDIVPLVNQVDIFLQTIYQLVQK